jgi:hypothetical protein
MLAMQNKQMIIKLAMQSKQEDNDETISTAVPLQRSIPLVSQPT